MLKALIKVDSGSTCVRWIKMARVMEWTLRNDPWIDNGLELLGHLLKSIQDQYPQVVQVCWEPESLKIIIDNERRFVDLLDDILKRQIDSVVFYTVKKEGAPRSVMKPFVGFNQQPPSQYPPIFQDVSRRQFLQEVFDSPASKGRDEPKGCPLCGEQLGSNSKDLTLSVYPFVTKIRALSGARSKWCEGLRGFRPYLSVCPHCYFLGSLVWADDALLYLCDIGGTDGDAVIVLPAPAEGNLNRLHEVKNTYRPRYDGRRTNVSFKRQPREDSQPQEAREVQGGPYSLLLAFLERTMDEITEKGEVADLFSEVQRRISEGWLILTIPQGRMKNITAHNLILDEPTLRLLAKLVEQGCLPYAHCISEIWIEDEKGARLQDIIPELREQLAKAILTDDFNLFAQIFIPKPRRQLRFSFAIESDVEKLVTLWRWSDMDAQILEVIKKAGRALAGIAASRKQPVLLYALERARSTSDLLKVLKESAHRLIGLDAEEMRYISLDALEQLTELLHRVSSDTRQFADLKNTLIIFAGIAYAKGTMAESRQTSAGGEA